MKLWANLVWLLVLHLAMPTVKAAFVGPQFLGKTPKIAGVGANRIFVQGNLAYVAAGTNGLVILDISNPLQPIRVGTLRNGGMAALEYSNPAKPTLIGGYDTPRNATSLRIFDNRLYVTDSVAGCSYLI